MKKISLILILAMLVGAGSLSAQVLQKLSGLIDSVNLGSHELRVHFQHPVTKEEIVKIIQVLPSTGFKNVKRLDQIKPHDPVSIDYKDDGKGTLHAVYIEVVSLANLPFDPNAVKKKFFSR